MARTMYSYTYFEFIREYVFLTSMKPILSLFCFLTIFSCTPEDGIDGLNGIDGIDGLDGTSIGILVEDEGNCKTISFYRDENNNSVFDNELILDRVTICNGEDGVDGQDGEDGQDGTNGLDGLSIGVLFEALDDGCKRLSFFRDENRDNLKDESETVISTLQLCDGQDGANGINGRDAISYVFLFSNASNSTCSQGGVSIDVYYDNDLNGSYSNGDTLFQTSTHCFTQSTIGSKFYLDSNGYTVKCPNATIGEKGILNGKEYIAVDSELLNTLFDGGYEASCLCTTQVIGMEGLYDSSPYSYGAVKDSDYDISNWDTSNVLSFKNFLNGGTPADFNQDISKWDVSSAYNFSNMLSSLPASFNRSISDWDVSKGKIFTGMFSYAEYFNQDISSWDVSNALDLQSMFLGATVFNQDIGSWNVSNAVNLDFMFYEAKAFNQDIGGWNTGKVNSMNSTFYNAIEFNQDIGNWDVSNVKSMVNTFGNAKKFNQNIGNWNTSKVTNMQNMFNQATEFNQDIGNWDVSNVEYMTVMFIGATSFNQDISRWNTNKVQDMFQMFGQASSFNQDLSGWSVGNVSQCSGFSALATSWTLPKPNFTNCSP